MPARIANCARRLRIHLATNVPWGSPRLVDIQTGQVALAREDALYGCKAEVLHPAYRQDAVRLVIDTDRTTAAVGREIGVGEALLGRWVAIERARMVDPPGALDVSERAELERLRTEVTQLRMDREFLKKAAAFFVAENNSNPSRRSS